MKVRGTHTCEERTKLLLSDHSRLLSNIEKNYNMSEILDIEVQVNRVYRQLEIIAEEIWHDRRINCKVKSFFREFILFARKV